MKKKRGLYDAMARRILEKEQQYPPTGVRENGKEDFRPVIEDFEPVVKAMAEARDHYIIIGTRDEIKEITDGINALTGSGVTAVEMEKLVYNAKKRYEYSQIGTPEECQAAMEKQTAKRPDYEGDGYADRHLVYDTWICPCCGERYEVDYDKYDFCPNCGQKIDWSRDGKGEEAGKNEENT